MIDVHVIPFADGVEVQWGEGRGYITIPNEDPPFFPHGDGFRMIFDGGNTRVEAEDGSVLWHCSTLTTEGDNMYDEKVLTAAREKVRGALGIYKRELELALDKVPRGSGHKDNEFDNLKASITQVESAKRVLWMED